MIERYLLEREQLADGAGARRRRGRPDQARRAAARLAAGQPVPHTVVATKLDKVKSNARPKRKKELAAGCQLEVGDVVWTSASKNVGLDDLRDRIRLWLTP